MKQKVRADIKITRQFVLNEIIFVVPTILFFVIIKILPMFETVSYSLTDWNGITSIRNFTGLENYIRLFKDSHYWYSMGFTLLFSLISVIFVNVLGFVTAYGLSKQFRGRNLLRAAFYLPYVLGGLVLGFVWKFVFLRCFPYLYELTGIEFFGLKWLGTTATAFTAMVIVQVWSLFGYMMLLYIAGLSVIPADCIESASIDGASRFQIVKSIIIPLLMPTFTRCLFLSFLTCMKVYDVNVSLTEGNPFRTSESVAFNIYKTAFSENAMGYGCAKALVFIAVILVISLLQVKITSGMEVEA